MSVNKAILIGNVGKDPEVRHLDSGANVANFTLATTERFKDRNGNNQEQTEWHNIVAWRSLADLAEKYIRKGSQIYVEGSIRTRQYESNGQTRYVTEIMANAIQLLGKRSDNQGGNGGADFGGNGGSRYSSGSQGSRYGSGSNSSYGSGSDVYHAGGDNRPAQQYEAPATAPSQDQYQAPQPEAPLPQQPDQSQAPQATQSQQTQQGQPQPQQTPPANVSQPRIDSSSLAADSTTDDLPF